MIYFFVLFKKCDIWYIFINRYFRCKDLDALFVHAGFTPGVSMRRQNPRMMMNMRSLTIEAGAPTSKVVEDRPWARYDDDAKTQLVYLFILLA